MRNEAMPKPYPTLHWTVEQVLSHCPRATAVFTHFRMACTGCPMAPYETLGEAIAAHELAPGPVLRGLRPACRGEVENVYD